ncbi:RNA 2',3'-cyclic phosphodiesterase [Bacillus sp. REN3]|uniref:RNA 2',3'-cyclic phosphodiesterase n=1 Tax=Bacillus sp. REN3 TaxID=2802440 RepID=UPI001AEEEF1F|nr:RNA 2',3'-cyclic phosphodiesterase [Bacillus sp. REN3]
MVQQAHYFYALELPAEVKRYLEKAAEGLKQQLAFKTWVHPHDYHITLAFLGNAPFDAIDTSNRRIEEALEGLAPFELRIDHLGTFGRKDSPRIFWAGLERSLALAALREKVFSACLDAGFTLEKRPFSPHITIARRWLDEAPYTYGQNPFEGGLPFCADRVVLYKTHLGNSPKYEPITIFPLAVRKDG